MIYKALYRKYRPLSFADVVGQPHITTILINQLKTDKIFHAYLFTGPRGTGKTSCAKILAKAVNCLSLDQGDVCGLCSSCKSIEKGEKLDITEIDAASNRGIDNIRNLREQVVYLPADSKYRVYIIDEVHMLSIEAFNALLKTLEEPPKHVVFILATTEVHKLPSTILSRCQRFDFRRIETNIICQQIKKICDKENIKIEYNAAMLIAAISDGGMRDALSTLDLCVSYSDVITEETVREACLMAGNDYLLEIADIVLKQDSGKALNLIDSLYKNAVDMQRLCEELISHYRNLMISKTVPKSEELIVCAAKDFEKIKIQAENYSLEFIMYAIRELSQSLDRMSNRGRREELEMVLIKLCNPVLSDSSEAILNRVAKIERLLSSKTTGKLTVSDTVTLENNNIDETKSAHLVQNNQKDDFDTKNEPAYSNPVRLKEWPEILKVLSQKCPIIVGFLQGSVAYISGDVLLIDYKNSQFLDLVKGDSPIYRNHIRKAAELVLGKTYKLGPYKAPNFDELQEKSLEEDPLIKIADKLSSFENLDK